MVILLLAIYWVFSHFSLPAETIDYNLDIRPIFNNKCIACHGGVKKQAGFSLLFREEALGNTRSGRPAILPGNADGSELMRRLVHEDPEERMPLDAPPLSQEEIDKIRRWIDQGAHWQDHWAFVKPQAAPLPAVSDSSWAHNGIDQFILHRLEQDSLHPSPEADKTTLIRRLSLDLTGLPPRPEQVQAFLADTSPKAYEKVVDSLLASPHFGERWAAMWLDLARFSDTKGYEKDQFRNVWRYRDYVIQSFNEDKPFDQFTIEQLAGDLLPQPTPAQLIATAYHRNTANNDEGGTDDEEFRTAALLDRVANTWEVWQGSTMACVQCHSHPYDPIRHEEFYQSLAFFNNTRDEDVPNESPTLAHFEPGDEAKIDQLKSWIGETLPKKEAALETQRLESLVRIGEPKVHPHAFDSLTNAALIDGKWLGGGHGGFARLKNIDLTGKTQLIVSYGGEQDKGWVEIRKDRADGTLIGRLDLQKAGNLWDTGKYRKVLIDLQPNPGKQTVYLVFQNPTASNPQDYVCSIEWVLFTPPFPAAGQDGYNSAKSLFISLLNTNPERTPILQENPADFRRKTFIFNRGDWLSKGAEVQPRTPGFLPDFKGYSTNRLGLARWLVSRDNPLTARVTVNRFWEQLFGNGLVESMEDFGSQGTPPSHPQLLDWLAMRLMNEHRWSIKKLLKEMVMSATYRQHSATTPQLTARDPANRLLARGPRFRLTAEQVRDQALATGGLLNLNLYGKSVMPPQPEGVWQVVYSGMEWKTSPGDEAHRRAIYTFWRRSSPYPSLMTFDAAGREVCVSRRIRTNTPLQAMVTLNDTVYLTAARGLATRMLAAALHTDEQIKHGYYRALFREPSSATLAILKKLYAEAEQYYAQHPQEMAKFLADKQAEKKRDCRQKAALTVVANAIMNLNAYLMKE
jgi:hypothetical protein